MLLRTISLREAGPQILLIAPLTLWFALSYMIKSWWLGERD
jgi:hypothetical protein